MPGWTSVHQCCCAILRRDFPVVKMELCIVLAFYYYLLECLLVVILVWLAALQHKIKMNRDWGKVKRFLESSKLLWNLSNLIKPFMKLVLVFVLVSGKVSESCPLSLDPTASHSIQISHKYTNDIGNSEDATTTMISFERLPVDENDKRSLTSSTSSMVFTILIQLVKLLVGTFMGEQWLSEKVALRRLGELKTSLFNYYSRRNLFGGTVEQARGHGSIGFPSLEGALLSLAFLTFSVFLIDLIQTLLNKLRMRNMPAATPAPAPAPAAYLGRTFSPFNITPPYFLHHFNNSVTSTYPVSMETLTTLSSKVLSAIEKPWRYSSTSSMPSATSSSR